MCDGSMVAPVGHQAALASGTLSRKDESRRKELQEKLALSQATESQLRDANESLKTRLKESEARTGKVKMENDDYNRIGIIMIKDDNNIIIMPILLLKYNTVNDKNEFFL